MTEVATKESREQKRERARFLHGIAHGRITAACNTTTAAGCQPRDLEAAAFQCEEAARILKTAAQALQESYDGK